MQKNACKVVHGKCVKNWFFKVLVKKINDLINFLPGKNKPKILTRFDEFLNYTVMYLSDGPQISPQKVLKT